MPTSTPDPRLPLEPEEYPLYSPPKRIGCSALTILPLILIAVFVFLFFRITPQLAQGMINPVRQLLNIALPTVEPTLVPNTPNAGSMATVTVEIPTVVVTATIALTPTVAVPPTPTALPEEFVQVANTGGQGVRLRAEPRLDADRVDGLMEGTVCKVIGADVSNADGTWRNVEVVATGQKGWVLNRWLIPAQKPNP